MSPWRRHLPGNAVPDGAPGGGERGGQHQYLHRPVRDRIPRLGLEHDMDQGDVDTEGGDQDRCGRRPCMLPCPTGEQPDARQRRECEERRVEPSKKGRGRAQYRVRFERRMADLVERAMVLVNAASENSAPAASAHRVERRAWAPAAASMTAVRRNPKTTSVSNAPVAATWCGQTATTAPEASAHGTGSQWRARRTVPVAVSASRTACPCSATGYQPSWPAPAAMAAARQGVARTAERIGRGRHPVCPRVREGPVVEHVPGVGDVLPNVSPDGHLDLRHLDEVHPHQPREHRQAGEPCQEAAIARRRPAIRSNVHSIPSFLSL